METTIMRIALVLVILIFGGLLVKFCANMFRDFHGELRDGTEEWEEFKERMKVVRLKANSLQPKQLNSKRN